MRTKSVWAAAVAFVAAAVLLPTAAQADPSFYTTPMFGIDTAPGGQLLVADAGKGVVDADTGALVASLPGVTDIAPIGRGDMLALTSTFAPGAHGALFRVSKGSVRKLADLQQYEVENDPAGDGTAEGSDPFDLERMAGGETLIADAAGNDLLVADGAPETSTGSRRSRSRTARRQFRRRWSSAPTAPITWASQRASRRRRASRAYGGLLPGRSMPTAARARPARSSRPA